MAKKTQESDQEIVTSQVEVNDFKELPKKEVSEPKLKIGEVLIAELDENGNETKTFVTNEHSAKTYFSDDKKFKLKKKG